MLPFLKHLSNLQLLYADKDRLMSMLLTDKHAILRGLDDQIPFSVYNFLATECDPECLNKPIILKAIRCSHALFTAALLTLCPHPLRSDVAILDAALAKCIPQDLGFVLSHYETLSEELFVKTLPRCTEGNALWPLVQKATPALKATLKTALLALHTSVFSRYPRLPENPSDDIIFLWLADNSRLWSALCRNILNADSPLPQSSTLQSTWV
ncbi:MAG: hypothetical protein FJZ63_01970 [Chlamydiae bacterium]|nr:hypothetical protein [Chlamydiota bacterium]